jgi:hypothetical protein
MVVLGLDVRTWTMCYGTFKRPWSIKSTRLNALACWCWNMIPRFGPWNFDRPGHHYMCMLKKGPNLLYSSNLRLCLIKKLHLHKHTNSKSHREVGVHDLICSMIPSPLALWLSTVGWEDFYLTGKKGGKVVLTRMIMSYESQSRYETRRVWVEKVGRKKLSTAK